MKWMRRLLMIYAALTLIGLGVALTSTLAFSEGSMPFQLSDTAVAYGEQREWTKSIDDILLAYAETEQLEWLAFGETGVFTPPSVNPYLFERDWSIRSEQTEFPDMEIQTILLESPEGDLHWIVWFSMPLEEVNEPAGMNFLHLGYSDEYALERTVTQTYYRHDDQTVDCSFRANYDETSKRLNLPSGNASAWFHDVQVVGFAAFVFANSADWRYFESSINLYDGTSADARNHIDIGFNRIRMDVEAEYEVSATWLKIRKETE